MRTDECFRLIASRAPVAPNSLARNKSPEISSSLRPWISDASEVIPKGNGSKATQSLIGKNPYATTEGQYSQLKNTALNGTFSLSRLAL
jgi:hypothetical protein